MSRSSKPVEQPAILRLLANRRRALGISQAEMARRMGTSQSAVSQLEARTDLMLYTLTQYAGALGYRLTITFDPWSAEDTDLPITARVEVHS